MADEDAEINKLHVVLLAEQNGKATRLEVTGADAQRIVGEDGAIWLRLTKSGDTYKAYYSNDGEVYRYFGTTTLSAEPERAGLMALKRGRDGHRPRGGVRLVPYPQPRRSGTGPLNE